MFMFHNIEMCESQYWMKPIFIYNFQKSAFFNFSFFIQFCAWVGRQCIACRPLDYVLNVNDNWFLMGSKRYGSRNQI